MHIARPSWSLCHLELSHVSVLTGVIHLAPFMSHLLHAQTKKKKATRIILFLASHLTLVHASPGLTHRMSLSHLILIHASHLMVLRASLMLGRLILTTTFIAWIIHILCLGYAL